MGAEIALILAREGADVVLAARTVADEDVALKTRPGTISDVAAKIRAMGRRAVPVKTDVGVKKDCERLAGCGKGFLTPDNVDPRRTLVILVMLTLLQNRPSPRFSATC